VIAMIIVKFTRRYGVYHTGEIAGFNKAAFAKVPNESCEIIGRNGDDEIKPDEVETDDTEADEVETDEVKTDDTKKKKVRVNVKTKKGA